MAVAVGRAGRPCVVADIDFANDRKLNLIDEFYEICATFHYREIMALSRALDISPNAIERWKYKSRFPRWDTAVDIIDWVKRGKPMRMESPWGNSARML